MLSPQLPSLVKVMTAMQMKKMSNRPIGRGQGMCTHEKCTFAMDCCTVRVDTPSPCSFLVAISGVSKTYLCLDVTFIFAGRWHIKPEEFLCSNCQGLFKIKIGGSTCKVLSTQSVSVRTRIMMLTAMCMTTGTTQVTKAVHRKMKDTLLRQRRTRSANILFSWRTLQCKYV